MDKQHIYRHSKPSLVNTVVEDFLINGSLSGATATACYNDTTNFSIPDVIDKWNGKLSNMGFTSINRYENSYSFWYQPSFKDESEDRIFLNSYSTVNVVYAEDFFGRRISHIATFIFRKGNTITTLVGNIDEFYDKVTEKLILVSSLIDLFSKAYRRNPNLSKIIKENFAFDLIKNNGSVPEELVKLVDQDILLWNEIADFLPDDIKYKYRGKINGENFNI